MTQTLLPFSSDAGFSVGIAPRVVQANTQNGPLSNTQAFARFVSQSQNLSVDVSSFEATIQVNKPTVDSAISNADSAISNDEDIHAVTTVGLEPELDSEAPDLGPVNGFAWLKLAQRFGLQEITPVESKDDSFIGIGSDFPPTTPHGFLNDEVWEDISSHDETGFFRFALHASAFERSGVFGRELISIGWQDGSLLLPNPKAASTSTRLPESRLNQEPPASMNGQGNGAISNPDGAHHYSGIPVADAIAPETNLSTIGERVGPSQSIGVEVRSGAGDDGAIRVLAAPSRVDLNISRSPQTLVSQRQSEQGTQQEAGEQSVSRLHDAIAKRLAGLAGKAQSQTVNVVVQVSASGVSVFARTGEMLRANRDELREEIRTVLAEYGFTGATIDIHAGSNLPRGDTFQGES